METCGTILVVDHDDVARAAASEVVRRLGLRVVSSAAQTVRSSSSARSRRRSRSSRSSFRGR